MERLLLKVEQVPGGCWILLGAKDKKGYGMFSVGHRCDESGRRRNTMLTASRVSYEIFNGKISNGKWVLHKCDNPECTNPDHLFLGDSLSNVQDMDSKGRRVVSVRFGHKHHNSKFSPDQIKKIKTDYSSGLKTQKDLVEEYNVNRLTIWKIVNNRSYIK